MFTEKQQEIADRVLKDLSANGYVWESDYASELQTEYSQCYQDCDYVLQVMVSDYRLLERYGGGFLKLTADGMRAAEGKFMGTVRSVEKEKRLPIVERKLKIFKIFIDIIIAVVSFILGRCSSVIS